MKEFEKITYDEEYGNRQYNVEKHLEWKVLDVLTHREWLYERVLIESLYDCESPIEQLMAFEIDDVCQYFSASPPISNIDLLGISKQTPIKVGKKTYRADFTIDLAFYHNGIPKQLLKLDIECDGHEFHHKTKEQVDYDNERTRAIQSAGYDVLHFSGSEIYRKPFGCGQEIKKYIIRKYYDFIKDQG